MQIITLYYSLIDQWLAKMLLNRMHFWAQMYSSCVQARKVLFHSPVPIIATASIMHIQLLLQLIFSVIFFS